MAALQGLHAWGEARELVLSPWLVVAPALLVLGALPLGWSYWLASDGSLAPLLARIFPALPRRPAGRDSLWQRIVYAPKLGTALVLGIACTLAEGTFHPYTTMLSTDWKAGHLLAWIVSAALAAETISHRDAREARPLAQGFVLVTFLGVVAVYLAIFEASARTVHFIEPQPWHALAMLAMSSVLLAVSRGWLAHLYRWAANALQHWKRESEKNPSPADEDHFARHSLSMWLTRVLIISAVVAVIAVLHSLSRTVFAHASRETLLAFFTATFAAAFGAQSAGRKVMTLFGGSDKPMPISGALAAYAGGFGLALALVLATTTALLWVIYPGCPRPASSEQLPVHLCVQGAEGVACDAQSTVMSSTREAPANFGDCIETFRPSQQQNVGAAALVLALLSLVLGSSHLFLNSSSQLPIYTARITRTFLGASNPLRMAETYRELRDPKSIRTPSPEQVSSQKAATQLMPGDDISLAEYWSDDATDGPYARGAPLHIINVTINETVDGRSRTQQADRKGLGLAIGPRALSAGVRHHAVLRWNQPEQLTCHATQGDASFSVFDFPRTHPASGNERTFDGETLSIGRWIGISGAAFSTGTGYRTNVGMSLLAGLANVRLGYWWDPGVNRRWDTWRVLGVLFWTHQYLQRELFARFPGTANKLWYLSDGGHFENTAAYELIRRRAARIVVLDAGCDPDSSLEDLGNLVRKARIDFGAEITFLDHDEIAKHVVDEAKPYIGTLSELARGTWERVDELHAPPSDEPKRKEHRLDSPDLSKRSLVHAALASVAYPNCEGQGLLLVIKPTITGGEPADVVRYHSEHAAFPHESTLDQFFGESQWESYRALGQAIGRRLCIGPNGPFREAAAPIVPKAKEPPLQA